MYFCQDLALTDPVLITSERKKITPGKEEGKCKDMVPTSAWNRKKNSPWFIIAGCHCSSGKALFMASAAGAKPGNGVIRS